MGPSSRAGWVTVTLAVLAAATPARGAWLAGSYRYKGQLVVAHTRVAQTLTNFPLLVSLTAPELRTVENGGGVRSSSGFDIVFADASDSVRLPHEIEQFDPSTGRLVAWVSVPTLSNLTDTTLSFYFGDPTVSASQENTAAVWGPSARGIWHLAESSGSARDSTAFASMGSVSNSVGRVAGQIGGAFSFPGVMGSHLVVADAADGHLDFGTGSFTYSVWASVSGYTGTWQVALDKGGISATESGYALETDDAGTALCTELSDGVAHATTCNPSVGAASGWVHWVGVVDRSAGVLRQYVNGDEVGTRSIAATGPVDSTFSFAFGGFSDGRYPWFGSLDEVRVFAGALSPEWIRTEYENQKSPNAFVSALAIQDGNQPMVPSARLMMRVGCDCSSADPLAPAVLALTLLGMRRSGRDAASGDDG